MVCIYKHRQTPQPNIGNPLGGRRSVGSINKYPSQGINPIWPRNIRNSFPAYITPLINHNHNFSLMRSQPSGPPPVRDDVDYHVMAMSTNISSFSVKIIRPPPKIAYRVYCQHKYYFLLLLIVVIFLVELLTNEIDGLFQEIICCNYARRTFVMIIAADVYSHHHVPGRDARQKKRVCLIMYIIP